ncbi:RbsD/FucU domain-containing protein [Abiotrophia defectiva]|uniref:RbsD/FucU family protein n=1 Tax=Abiotrophia defectiva TaxID=46125 RepID=UPI0028D7F4B7|nr:RbsD/FucU domain-containing protein [Abiotrophia defectiva]
MLKHIPAILSPDLVKYLMEMGHGDELVIADANFPAHRLGQRVIRADGHGVPELLDAILTLLPLDPYSDYQAGLMQVVPGDPTVPVIWEKYKAILDRQTQDQGYQIKEIERFAFYEQAKDAYIVIQSGETALYGNIILKKGVL